MRALRSVATSLALALAVSGCAAGQAVTAQPEVGRAWQATAQHETDPRETARPATSAPSRATGRVVRSGCNVDTTLEVCFSSPGTRGGSDPAVVRRFIEVFDEAGAGDSLRVAMFRWDIPATTTALLGALDRGAHVELVADADVATKPAGRQLLAQLRAAGATAVVCQGACLPWRGSGPAPPSQDVNHLKLVLAEIGGRRSVITSSTNFEGRQYSQYNSLTRVYDDGLYDFSLGYFQRLLAQSWTLGGQTWKDRQKAYGGPPPAAVYPRRSDLVLSTLKQVRCVPGARSVDIMVAVIQRHDVRAQIGRLAQDGCRVRIVTTRDLIENWLQKPFRLPDGSKVDLPDRNVRTVVTHDKVYAIHAKVAGTVQHVVLTGTSNTTCGGLLYNDEMMLRLDGAWAFRVFSAHVGDAFKHAHQARTGVVPVQARCR